MGSIIAALFTPSFIGLLLKPLTDIFTAYINKQITQEQLRVQLLSTFVTAFADVEKQAQQSGAQTFTAFMTAMVQSRVVQYVWASVVLVQLAVLVWAQVGIPFMVYHYGGTYPSSGATIDYAYLLIGLLCGGGPLLLKPKVQDYKALASK